MTNITHEMEKKVSGMINDKRALSGPSIEHSHVCGVQHEFQTISTSPEIITRCETHERI